LFVRAHIRSVSILPSCYTLNYRSPSWNPMLHDSSSFFFQAEDGIRDRNVTGVQTCALPILAAKHYFDTVVVSVEDVETTMAKADEAGYNLRRFSDTQVGISTDETTTDADVEALTAIFGAEVVDGDNAIPDELIRKS